MQPTIFTHIPVSQVVEPDGSVTIEWQPREVPFVPEHHDVYHEQKWVSVREERNQRLAKCDWVVAKAIETGQPIPPEWARYRQALRDLPTSSRNPFQIVWPTAPT